MAAGDEDAGATRAAVSRAWTARWAVRQNGPHRAIPGHAMRARGNIKIGKNHPENTLIHPHAENDS